MKQTVDPTFQRWRCDTGPPPCQHPCRVDHLWGGRGYHTALFDVSSLRLHSDSMTPSSSSNHPLPLCTKPHCRREHNQTCLESACTVYIVLNYVVIDKSKSFGIFPPVVELYYKKIKYKLNAEGDTRRKVNQMIHPLVNMKVKVLDNQLDRVWFLVCKCKFWPGSNNRGKVKR